jgi:uncharacterized phage protein (TIGR02220 family)
MENKKYYWIKLRKDFFERDDIDFILSQEKGCEYIVLYQMLCMKASNNDGFLGTKIDEVIVPYDVKKITRDCKYFDYDTVMVALELYKKLGLIYEEENNVLRITDYEKLVGSETAWAEKKRVYRERQNEKTKLLGQKEDIVREEIEKEIEIDIDKDIDIDIDNNISKSLDKSKSLDILIRNIVGYLNEKANTHYKISSQKTKRLINTRLCEGYTFEDFKVVIDKKCTEWLNTDMSKYLRPETLFGTKFESYLNQKVRINDAIHNNQSFKEALRKGII